MMTPKRRREIDAVAKAIDSMRRLAELPSRPKKVRGKFRKAPRTISRDTLRKMTEVIAAAMNDTLAEIDRLAGEIHDGHVLIDYRPRSGDEDRPGWMECVKRDCSYITPSAGWCPEHRRLDACWSAPAKAE